MPRLLIILPSLNEEESLPALLVRLEQQSRLLKPDWQPEVLVIDDGSSDKTAACAGAGPAGLPIALLRHEHNLGLGCTIRSGIEYALARLEEHDAVAVMDSDLTHPPELLGRMLARLLEEKGGERPVDVVIASRYAPGGAEHGLPPMRRCYSRLASLALGLIAPIRGVRDYTCGYRVYRVAALRRASAKFGPRLVEESGFVCMAELLVKLARSGARMAEVGLDLHYELKGGLSKMNVAATIRRYVVLAGRILFDPRLR